MKQYFLILSLSLFYFSSKDQKMDTGNLSKRISAIEDRIAIKNLVDTFSILADTKEIDKQILLFTENATVQSTVNGTTELAVS